MQEADNKLLTTDKTKVLYLGTRDSQNLETIQKLSKALEGDVKIIVLDKEQMNRVDSEFIKKIGELSSKEDLNIMIRNPKNVAMAFEQAEMLYKHVANKLNNKFTLKDVVDNSNLTYKTAGELLEALYAYGFVSHRNDEANRKYYYMTVTIEEKNAFIDFLEADLKQQLADIKSMRKTIKTSVKERNKLVGLDEHGVEIPAKETPTAKAVESTTETTNTDTASK